MDGGVATQDPPVKDPLGLLKPQAKQSDPLGLLSQKKSPVGNASAPTSQPSSNGSKTSPPTDPILAQYWKSLNPDEQKALSKGTQQSQQQHAGENLRAPTREETADYNYSQTLPGKIQNGLTYLAQKATKGGLQVVKGAAYLAQLGANAQRGITDDTHDFDEAFQKADKATDFLSKGNQARVEDSKVMGNLGGLAEFLPSMAAAEGTGGATLYLQGLGQGKENIEQAEANGAKIDPVVKNAFILGSGAVNGFLMGEAGSALFKSLGTSLKNDVVSEITTNAIKEAAGKDLTAEEFNGLLKQGAKTWQDKAFQTGVNYLENTKHAITNLGALNVADFALKKGVDMASDKPVFNETPGQLVDELGNTLKTGAAFGLAGSLLTPFSQYKNAVVDNLIHDSSDENVAKTKQFIEQQGQQQGWTPEQIQATNAHVDELAKVTKSIPKGLAPDKAEKAVDLVIGRNDLMKQSEQFIKERSQLDDVFKDQVSPAEQLVNDKISQANDKLLDLANGTKTTYSKGIGDDEGKFFKTTDGKKTEIEEIRYKLEKTERDANAAKNNTPEDISGNKTESTQITTNQQDNEKVSESKNREKEEGQTNDAQQSSGESVQDEKGNVATSGAQVPETTETKGGAENAINQEQVEKSGGQEHQEGDESRKTAEAGSSDSVERPTEKPRYKIKGDQITRLPVVEHVELNNLLKEDGITIGHLKNANDTQRNESGDSDAETPIDAQAVQQPENDGTGNAGENRSGKSDESGKGTKGKTDFKKPDSEQKVDEPTGIKKVLTEATRIEKKLPDVELPKLGKDKETLEKGKKLVSSEQIKPADVIDRVNSGQGIYTPDEAAAIQYHMHQLKTHESDLRQQLVDINEKLAQKDLSPTELREHSQAKITLLGNLRQLDDRIDDATKANRINSRSWSNLGNIMQIEADHSFDPSNVRSIIADNYGGSIPKEVQERINKAESERDKAISDLKKANDSFTQKEGGKVVEKIRKSVGLVKQTKAELQEEAETLKKDLIKAWKKDITRVNSGIPLPTESMAVLGKLAVNYFKQGVKDFEGLANKIYDDLKDHIDGIDKKDIKNYLSSYDPLREASKERDIELLGRKERSANKQVETGKVIDRSRKPKIVYPKDNEIIKAEQRVADAEFKLKQEKAKSYKFAKTKTQRALDFAIRWERRFVLSSPGILEKLASAVTIGGGLKRLPEEAIGGIWSGLFKAMADKAPIEGGFNAKAEAEYWKEFSNPKKFWHNTKEIFKTGSSDLTKQFGDDIHEHYQFYDALTDLHPIIKDISKRATYEASLIKGYKWAQLHGLDISEPLIRQSIKQQAYTRAEYEIFQEKSVWGKKLQDFLRDERTPKSTKEMLIKFGSRFMLPVNLVPLNIARRIGNYVTGLPRGLYNAREAYKNGIDNLSNEQAEIIMKQLKQGSMGAALFSMGLFGVGGKYGGLYNRDDKRGLKRTGEKHPGFDQMYFGGTNIPKPVQHAIPLQVLQTGATYKDILDLYLKKNKKDGTLERLAIANGNAIMGTVGSVAEQIPMIETPFEMYGALKDPYERKKLGKDMMRRVTPSIVTDAVKLAEKNKKKK